MHIFSTAIAIVNNLRRPPPVPESNDKEAQVFKNGAHYGVFLRVYETPFKKKEEVVVLWSLVHEFMSSTFYNLQTSRV